MTLTLTGHAEVSALLADPRVDVLSAPPGPRGLAWLRGAGPRFSRGVVHTGRRVLAVRALDGVAPAALRMAAAELARDPARHPRDVPVGALARALGLRRPVLEQVRMITAGYLSGEVLSGRSEVDDAVEELLDAFGGIRDELTAARIALLVQAHDATGGLVANALAALSRGARGPLPSVLAETLRHDPPVPIMRRQCLVDHEIAGHGRCPAGTVVVLDLARANRDPAVFADPARFDPTRPGLERVLTFGAGLRPCPGRDHAVALALGAVEGALDRARPRGTS